MENNIIEVTKEELDKLCPLDKARALRERYKWIRKQRKRDKNNVIARHNRIMKAKGLQYTPINFSCRSLLSLPYYKSFILKISINKDGSLSYSYYFDTIRKRK